MDHEENQRRLRQLFDEVDTPESSIEDPFSTDDDDDLDYITENSSSDENSNDSDSESNLEDNDEEVNDQINEIESDEAVGFTLDEEWYDTVRPIPDFKFESASSGVQLKILDSDEPLEIFNKIFEDILKVLITCTNEYGRRLCSEQRGSRFKRMTKFPEIDRAEMLKFLGLCLLQGQIQVPQIRNFFSKTALYYHPAFPHSMSGRRFEQILRCFSANHMRGETHISKIVHIIKLINQSFQAAYKPSEQIVLDESLLLHKGRLSFRQYIKSKRARFGIKFFELCDPSGYVFNLEVYKGKQAQPTAGSKIEAIVHRLISPYVGKGHHLYMDNYYNSITLSNELLLMKTHTTGTLRSNRKGNPIEVVNKKLNKGEHVWKRQGNVYISKWHDKRIVLCITTAFHPKLIESQNRRGSAKMKPIEIFNYNKYMGGVDRTDQMVSYYSSPRKTIRWYKKVIFHLLDLSVYNAYVIYKKRFPENSQLAFLTFRDNLIYGMLKLKKSQFHPEPPSRKRKCTEPVTMKHFLEVLPRNSRNKKKYIRCRQCSKSNKRKDTNTRCAGCDEKPGLCVGKCFTDWHQ